MAGVAGGSPSAAAGLPTAVSRGVTEELVTQRVVHTTGLVADIARLVAAYAFASAF